MSPKRKYPERTDSVRGHVPVETSGLAQPIPSLKKLKKNLAWTILMTIFIFPNFYTCRQLRLSQKKTEKQQSSCAGPDTPIPVKKRL